MLRSASRQALVYKSPGTVSRPVTGGAARSRVHVDDAGFLLVHRHHHIFLDHFPVGFLGHGIHRNLPQIARLHEVVERLRGLLLVEGVLLDDIAQCVQVRSQNGLARLDDGSVVIWDRDRHQDHDDADYDHHLKQRKTAGMCSAFDCGRKRAPLLISLSVAWPARVVARSHSIYQSLYFVPSSAGAFRLGVDVEYALSAPGVGVGIVLHRPHAPLFALGHGVYRDRTQKTDFLAALRFDSLDQVSRDRADSPRCPPWSETCSGQRRPCSGRWHRASPTESWRSCFSLSR